MTREEFMREMAAADPEGNKQMPTDREYKIIEKVYASHPSIDPVEGKRQIAELYVYYGMVLIMDMLPRAGLMEGKREELRAAMARMEQIREEIEEIKEGRNIRWQGGSQ